MGINIRRNYQPRLLYWTAIPIFSRPSWGTLWWWHFGKFYSGGTVECVCCKMAGDWWNTVEKYTVFNTMFYWFYFLEVCAQSCAWDVSDMEGPRLCKSRWAAKEASPPVCVLSHQKWLKGNDLCQERNGNECQKCYSKQCTSIDIHGRGIRGTDSLELSLGKLISFVDCKLNYIICGSKPSQVKSHLSARGSSMIFLRPSLKLLNVDAGAFLSCDFGFHLYGIWKARARNQSLWELWGCCSTEIDRPSWNSTLAKSASAFGLCEIPMSSSDLFPFTIKIGSTKPLASGPKFFSNAAAERDHFNARNLFCFFELFCQEIALARFTSSFEVCWVRKLRWVVCKRIGYSRVQHSNYKLF